MTTQDCTRADNPVTHFELQLMLPISVNYEALTEKLAKDNYWSKLENTLERDHADIDDFDPAHPKQRRSTQDRYAEKMYFHPTIQRRLGLGPYDDTTKTANPNMKAWQCRHWSRLEFVLPWKDELEEHDEQQKVQKPHIQNIGFKVRGIQLHAFDLQDEMASGARHDVAILSLCLQADIKSAQSGHGWSEPDNTLTIDGVLNALDCIRRVWSGYFKEVNFRTPGGPMFCGRMPSETTLWPAHGQETKRQTSVDKAFVEKAIKEPNKAVTEWVKDIMGTTLLQSIQDGEPNRDLRLLGDERMHQMAYISIQRPKDLTEAQLVRLAYADYPGTAPEDFPYYPGSLEGWQKTVAYDRWRHYGTRYFCTGYNWVALTATPTNSSGRDFIVLPDFRGAYYQLGLLACLYKAAIQHLSERMSDVLDGIHDQLGTDQDAKENRAEAAYESALIFSQRYWFESPTAQFQGKELFQMWCQQNGIYEQYERVMHEAQTVREYQSQLVAKKQNRLLEHLTFGQFSLAAVTLIAQVIGIDKISKDSILLSLAFLLSTIPVYYVYKLYSSIQDSSKNPLEPYDFLRRNSIATLDLFRKSKKACVRKGFQVVGLIVKFVMFSLAVYGVCKWGAEAYSAYDNHTDCAPCISSPSTWPNQTSDTP